MAIKSLSRRLTLLTLIPIALFLISAGFVGFLYAKDIMIDQWREAALTRLARAAHQIDMMLQRPMSWIEMFHRASDERAGRLIQEWIIQRIREIDGVIEADLKWKEGGENYPAMPPSEHPPMPHDGAMFQRQGIQGSSVLMGRNRGRIAEVMPPSLNPRRGDRTVDIRSQLRDKKGETVGELVVTMRFDHLMRDVLSYGWWQSDAACLVDEKGSFLAHTASFLSGRTRLGENGSELELRILEAMEKQDSGTVMGPGRPPDEVAGFFKLHAAPWTLVLTAPGEKILGPIIRYRAFLLGGALFCAVVVILLIRVETGKTIASVVALSKAARRIANGDYSPRITVGRSDEIGELTESFNYMVEGLKERDFILDTFGRYVDKEVAQTILKRPEASRLGGQRREVAILMSDIRGFTPLCETLEPEKIIYFLNNYLSKMIDIVHSHKGIIVDFFGDSVLVFFDPYDEPLEHCVVAAVRCALEMGGAMGPFNIQMKADGMPELQMGIGIHAGEVIVGNIGSTARAKYGIVGSPVNLTQRIQSLAMPGEILISDYAYKAAASVLKIERTFSASVKGFDQETLLHTLSNWTAVARSN